MAAGLLSLAIVSWVALQISSRSTENVQDQRQEYYRQVARLEDRVKRDIRSCLQGREEAPGTFVLDVLWALGDEEPQIGQVTYRREEEGRIILRDMNGATETFDFRPWLEDRRFVFELKFE